MATTITTAERTRLENKAKVGWKTYYILRDDYDRLCNYYSQARSDNRKLVEQIKSGGECDTEFLKKQFLELYEKVGELTDCPVCFETLTKENSEVPNCGHLICKGCKLHICNVGNKECPICKTKYWIKNN
jgi:hypothetical protein